MDIQISIDGAEKEIKGCWYFLTKNLKFSSRVYVY